ncbi:hypothetical protein QFZ31_000687 [Neobacillus niacini]|uniref:hypothetical protein n=1 Tax=Neobacillus driksii TaxID=3035913 RepID=UPI00278A7E6E|nr:hypothetical protein [Neobacillus niacini]MDQ0970809.1 hypothetical protein [Neobacillus niacini]
MGFKIVIYKGEKCWLIYQYDSGYCEIKKEGFSLNRIELVHMSELIEEKREKQD